MNKLANQFHEEIDNSNDKDLVELAGYDSYKYYKKDNKLKVNGNKYYVVNTKYKDKTGLDALTIQKIGTNELTVVFVGTDISAPNGKQDLLTDIQLLSSMMPAQLKAAGWVLCADEGYL